MFLQIVGQCFTHSLLHSTSHLAVTQLSLGLSFKLRLSHLHADDCGKSFAEVFTTDFNLLLLQLLRNLVVVSILLQHACQCSTETLQVCTTFDGVDVVDVRVDIFAIRSVIHDSHLDRRVLLFCVQINHVVEEAGACRVDITHEILQTTFAVEDLLTDAFNAHLSVFVQTHVCQRNLDTCIQISKFAHTVCQDVILVGCGDEDAVVWPELLTGASQLCLAHHFHVVEWLSLLIFLLVHLAVTEHL